MSVRCCEVESTTEFMPLSAVKNGISQPSVKKWAYILHDKDTDVKPHYHVLLWFKSPVEMKYVAKWFGVQESQVQKIKSEIGAMVYLTHGNSPEKFPYNPSEVVSNFDVVAEVTKQKKAIASNARKEEIINLIVSGKAKGYNLDEFVSPVEYDKFKKAIDNAFAYRKMLLMKDGDAGMSVKVIWVHGNAGTGKTRWAKMYATGKGQSYFVSGSGSDFLDGYAGQDCLILDDIRPESMAAATMLKLLDNNTRSSVKSRYANKWLEVKTIIVTCPVSPEDFWEKRKDAEKIDGTLAQLLRRIYINAECVSDDFRGNVMRIRQFTSDGRSKNWSSFAPNPAMLDLAVSAFDDDMSPSEEAMSEIFEFGMA